jgi:hypothetical protein
MKNFFRKRMPPEIFGAFFLDLEDRVRAQALQAHRAVIENFSLSPKRSRELEGQARFRMMEQAFEDTCVIHGGKALINGIIPHSDLKVFQPFHRFEYDGQGVILGLAVMPEANSLPTKNISRGAGVTLNYSLQPSLFAGDGPQIGDIFVLFLVEKDRQTAGQLAEIAVGIIDAGYTQYLHYEPLSSYLQGHADIPDPTPDSQGPTPPNLRLKPNVKPFKPPELSEEGKKIIEENDE